MTKLKQLKIRWLIHRDRQDVVAIESFSFANPWSDDDFSLALRQSKCIGLVAEHKDDVIGFVIYELEKHALRIINLAVSPAYRKRGVGSALVQRLIDKLSIQKRKFVEINVRESDLRVQKFLQSKGFWATKVLRNHYEDSSEDAYLFRYTLKPTEDMNSPYNPANRISEHMEP